MIKLITVISTRFFKTYMMTKFLGMGKDDVQETKTATPYGFDSAPIKDIVGVQVQTTVNGENVVIGFLGKNGKAEAGESRMFSTDENGGVQIDLYVKKDGTIEFGGNVGNLTRYQELKTGFDELKQDFNNLVNLYNTHVHAGVTPGPSSSGTTPSVGTPSVADISGSKIDELKSL